MSEVTAVPLRPIAKGSLVKLWLGVAVVLGVGVSAAYLGTHKQVVMAQTPEEFLAGNAKRSGVITTPSGLQYEVIEPGNGAKPTTADVVRVEYTGKLVSGVVFDSTDKKGPAMLPVGGGIIPGWTEGLQLMPQGSKYRFWIPPHLAYGATGAGNGVIPPNAITIFDVKLLETVPASAMGGMGMGGHGGM